MFHNPARRGVGSAWRRFGNKFSVGNRFGGHSVVARAARRISLVGKLIGNKRFLGGFLLVCQSRSSAYQEGLPSPSH